MRNDLRIGLVFAVALLADSAFRCRAGDRKFNRVTTGGVRRGSAPPVIERGERRPFDATRRAAAATSDADPLRPYSSRPAGRVRRRLAVCPGIQLSSRRRWQPAKSFHPQSRNYFPGMRASRAIQQPVTLTARSTGVRHICTPSRSQMVGAAALTADSLGTNLPAGTFDRRIAGSSLPALTSWRRALVCMPVMKRNSEIQKIAFVGDYLPRKCGIATFTYDVCTSVATQYPGSDCFVVPINDISPGYDYPAEVRFEIEEQDVDSYLRAADFLNFANADIVSLQHEYGIFGGPAGSHIVRLLRDLRMPIVTTLHTVLPDPSSEQRRVLTQVAELSARLVVMSERARTFLRDIYNVADAKIDLIAHGIPDMPFVDPNFYKDQFGVEGKFVALTFGLLSPNKGIELMLRAMPEILKEFPNFVYIVLGATHPNLIREQGERYRISLERLAKDLGIKNNVSFYNRFVEIDELIEFIGMADIYVTPYLNPAQITSGTLAYSFGCGKAVVSTPYWYAEELLADGRGVSFRLATPKALAREICELLRDDPRRHSMRKKAYMLGREMIWSHVAHLYMESFQRARRSRLDMPYKPLAVRTLAEQPMDLPGWRLDHLVRMTDSAGILQHANSTIPNFAEGYCTDDNARALLLTVLLEQLGHSSAQVHRLATTYAAFLNYALDRDPQPVPQFSGFRSDLARKSRLRRQPWPGPLGARCLRRPLEAARPPVLGVSAFRPGAADDHRNDLAAGLGVRPDRRVPVSRAIQRRPAGQPGARHA